MIFDGRLRSLFFGIVGSQSSKPIGGQPSYKASLPCYRPDMDPGP